MLDKVLQLLSFSCRHRRTSKPFAAATTASARAVGDWEAVTPTSTGHYVVCLDCGRKFAYDWSEMRIVK